jgi:hypothetical protein
MGINAPQIEAANALKMLSNEATRPLFKKWEFWIGVIANVLAIIALLK